MAVVQQKRTVSGHDSDKVMYFYKLPKHEPLANKCHPLGLNGASSTTNTKTLATTQTKTANIKGTGSINQQRVVNVIFTDPKKDITDVARDLYVTWEAGDVIALWRVDWNTVRGTKGNRVVNAEYSECLIATLPETEALGANTASNVTFEVQGIARRYDSLGNPYTLSEADMEDGAFDMAAAFYNFTKPSETGLDGSGNEVNNAKDDATTGDATGTRPYTGSGATSPSVVSTTHQ